MVNNHFKVQILENYKNFTPPEWVPKAVSRLLDGLPKEYLSGLRIITLSNSEGLNRHRMRQKTLSMKNKVAIRDTRGLYYQEWKGQPARIELFIDKIIYGWPKIILKINLVQDAMIADVLYHELGHHIHKTSAPEYKEREDVAENWRRKLGKQYFPRRYWYFKPLLMVLKFMAWLSKLTHPKPTGFNN